MVTKEQLSYILQQLQRGEKPEAIKAALLSAGWQQQDIDQAFTQVYQTAGAVPDANPDGNVYPIISIQKIENPNRFFAIPLLGGLIKLLLCIPVGIEMVVLLFIAQLLLPINALIVLFTGKYWKTLFNLIKGFMVLNTKVGFYTYGLTNKHPGFSLSINDAYSYEIGYPDKSSRFFAIPILGMVSRIILLIPFMVYSGIIQYAAILGTVFGSLVVLFAGKYPESIFEFARDATRLNQAMFLYSFGISDKYPSFNISWNHKGIKIFLIVITFMFSILNVFIPKEAALEPMQDTTSFEEDFYNIP